MKKRTTVGAALLGALSVSCGEPSGSSLECGPGTMEVNGACVVADGAGGNNASGGGGGTEGDTTSTDSGGTAGDIGENGGTSGASTSSDTAANSSGGSAMGTGGNGSGGAASNSGGATSSTCAAGGTGGDTSGAGGSGGEPIATEPFECGSRNVTGATQVEGTIVEDTTWSGLIHVIGDVSVRNEATLTIEPGTKIIVSLDAGIDFGWENSHPKLLAEGTPEAPILFCGETDTPGYWDSLSFEPSVDPASVLRNVLIQEAGAESAALVVDGPVGLQGVQVVDSGNDGVEASVFGAGSTVLSIHNSGQYAGRATSQWAVDWPDGLDFTGNLHDRIHLSFTELSESVQFEAKGAGFVQDGPLLPADGGSGLTVRFGPGIAYDNTWGVELGAATLLVEGTESDPVTFTGAVNVSAGTIQHARFEPPSHELLRLYGPVSLQNVAYEGIQLVTDGVFTPDSHGLQPNDPESYIHFQTTSCAALSTLPPDTEMPADGRIVLDCGLDATTISLVDVGGRYDIRDLAGVGSGASVSIEAGVVVEGNQWSVGSGGTLTIAPGARLRLGSLLTVRGTLSAEGDPDAPIVFEGRSGAWLGINVQPDSALTLDHAVVDGVTDGEVSSPHAAVKLYGPASITNTTIQNSTVWGLLHTEEDTTDYSVSNTFINNALGDIGAF